MIKPRTGFIIILIIVILFLISVMIQTRDYDCSDFKTQVQAYKVFRKSTEDIYSLDGDRDGLPCEMLPTK